MNALHCAAEMGHFEAAKLLLSNDKFLELNAKDWVSNLMASHESYPNLTKYVPLPIE